VAMTVTATQGTPTNVGMAMSVLLFSNAAAPSVQAASGKTGTKTTSSGALSLAITPNSTGSRIVGAMTNGVATSFTALASTTLKVNFTSTGPGNEYGTMMSAAATTAATPVTIGASAPTGGTGGQIALAEILASGGTLTEDTANEPAAVTSASALNLTTASFTPTPGDLVVLLVTTSGGNSGSTTLTITNTGSLVFTQLVSSAVSFYGCTAVYVAQVVGTLPGTGGLSGSGTLGGTGTVTVPGTAGLSGAGTLGGLGAFRGAAGLTGLGTLTGIGTGGTAGSAALTGLGSLTGIATGLFTYPAGLAGVGTLTGLGTAIYPVHPALSGVGTLALSGYKLNTLAGLSGSGTLSVLQATGGLVFASPGVATPQAQPGSSQVAVAPQGSNNWQFLGTVGAVTALTYSFQCPGGADKMTCTVMVPASYRSQLFWPGWKVRITRGGHTVWTGRLDEPTPTGAGWNLTAVGDGNRGADFAATYTSTWPASQPDQSINNAITRGLPWTNTAGIGTPSGAWYGQSVDSGAQTIAGLLTLVCTRGALVWYVNSQPGGFPGTDVTVFPLPVTPNRLLISSNPVPRTLGGDVNSIIIRYQATADTTSSGGVAATYSTTTASNAQSIAAHGVTEAFIDLSDVGVMTATAAQAVGNNVLAIYQRASFTTAFTGSYGQLCNMGGTPIDPGTDPAGTVCKTILTDYGYGGEVVPGPVQFIVGGYSWDDFAQQFTITPYQGLDLSVSGLLSMTSTVLQPITAASS
jgi:hypothetical protein